jgi:hypothetical protein
LGVEAPFSPALRAHRGAPPPISTRFQARLGEAGVAFEDDAKIAGVDRRFVADPFGNRSSFAPPELPLQLI